MGCFVGFSKHHTHVNLLSSSEDVVWVSYLDPEINSEAWIIFVS